MAVSSVEANKTHHFSFYSRPSFYLKVLSGVLIGCAIMTLAKMMYSKHKTRSLINKKALDLSREIDQGLKKAQEFISSFQRIKNEANSLSFGQIKDLHDECKLLRESISRYEDTGEVDKKGQQILQRQSTESQATDIETKSQKILQVLLNLKTSEKELAAMLYAKKWREEFFLPIIANPSWVKEVENLSQFYQVLEDPKAMLYFCGLCRGYILKKHENGLDSGLDFYTHLKEQCLNFSPDMSFFTLLKEGFETFKSQDSSSQSYALRQANGSLNFILDCHQEKSFSIPFSPNESSPFLDLMNFPLEAETLDEIEKWDLNKFQQGILLIDSQEGSLLYQFACKLDKMRALFEEAYLKNAGELYIEAPLESDLDTTVARPKSRQAFIDSLYFSALRDFSKPFTYWHLFYEPLILKKALSWLISGYYDQINVTGKAFKDFKYPFPDKTAQELYQRFIDPLLLEKEPLKINPVNWKKELQEYKTAIQDAVEAETLDTAIEKVYKWIFLQKGLLCDYLSDDTYDQIIAYYRTENPIQLSSLYKSFDTARINAVLEDDLGVKRASFEAFLELLNFDANFQAFIESNQVTQDEISEFKEKLKTLLRLKFLQYLDFLSIRRINLIENEFTQYLAGLDEKQATELWQICEKGLSAFESSTYFTDLSNKFKDKNWMEFNPLTGGFDPKFIQSSYEQVSFFTPIFYLAGLGDYIDLHLSYASFALDLQFRSGEDLLAAKLKFPNRSFPTLSFLADTHHFQTKKTLSSRVLALAEEEGCPPEDRLLEKHKQKILEESIFLQLDCLAEEDKQMIRFDINKMKQDDLFSHDGLPTKFLRFFFDLGKKTPISAKHFFSFIELKMDSAFN